MQAFSSTHVQHACRAVCDAVRWEAEPAHGVSRRMRQVLDAWRGAGWRGPELLGCMRAALLRMPVGRAWALHPPCRPELARCCFDVAHVLVWHGPDVAQQAQPGAPVLSQLHDPEARQWLEALRGAGGGCGSGAECMDDDTYDHVRPSVSGRTTTQSEPRYAG